MENARILFLFISVLIILPAIIQPVSSESVSRVSYNIVYDPLGRRGYATVTINVNTNTTSEFYIQVFNPRYGGSFNMFNYTTDNPSGLVLPPSFNGTSGFIDFVANFSMSITLYFIVEDLFTELTPGAFDGMMDFTMFQNTSFTASILLPGYYQVVVRRVDIPARGATVSYSYNTTLISFDSPGLYHIVLILSSTIPKTVTGENPGIDLIIIAVSIGVALAIAVFFLYWKFRRREVILERVTPGYLESDDIVREIILLLGDAGKAGLKQSDIVSMTGRPKSSISRRVKKLVEEGYVKLDRRGKYNVLVLTEKGFELYNRLKKR
ncbi:helix-turn-helix transcriptional regulator [Thermogladius sp. 4427co]|uniref:helix-turn-helix transcriptional regulator n=1 Tax=Thermogladius sp. 4427co TaxID=3450718 RepID=UPI003F78DCB0